MVAQIGFIGRDIRANIDEISKFSHFIITAEDESKLVQAVESKLKQATKRISTRKSAIKSFDQFNKRAQGGSKVQFKIVTRVRPCREYFSKLYLVRNEKVSRMKKLLESIGPILIKLESLILGTFTGESAKMKQYYVYWEGQIFQLLIG